MNLREYFKHIYVLNLPHRVDRRNAAVDELNSVDINLEEGKVEIFPAIKPDEAEPFHKLGSKGCFLSVLEILKKSRRIGDGHILILQDDISFPHFFKDYESHLLQELDNQAWDIAQFGYCSTEKDLASLHLPFASWKDVSETTIGAHFFAVNDKTVDRYIQFLELLLSRPRNHPDGGPMPIDGTFTVFRQQNPDIVRLLAVPSFGGQRSSRSDVTPRWFDKLPVASNIAQFYRNIKDSR